MNRMDTRTTAEFVRIQFAGIEEVLVSSTTALPNSNGNAKKSPSSAVPPRSFHVELSHGFDWDEYLIVSALANLYWLKLARIG